MAGQTNLCRRHSRKTRLLHRRMAIATVEPVVADMMFVAEADRLRYRLFHCDSRLHSPARDEDRRYHADHRPDRHQLDRKNGSAAECLRHKGRCREAMKTLALVAGTTRQ